MKIDERLNKDMINDIEDLQSSFLVEARSILGTNDEPAINEIMGVVTAEFSTINVKNSTYAKADNNIIKILKTGFYKISLSARWKDVKEKNNCGAGYSVNGDITNLRAERIVWNTNTDRLTINAIFITELNKNDTIQPLFHSNSQTDIIEYFYWIEKI